MSVCSTLSDQTFSGDMVNFIWHDWNHYEMSIKFGVTGDSYSVGLVGAVNRGKPERLKELLQSKAVHGQDDLAKALHVAAEHGHEECVEVLLAYKAMPDIHDASGFIPLIIAAKQGHAGIVRMLIDAGSNVNKPTFRIRATALHWSSTNGHAECAKALLRKGCNPEPKTIHGRTPLMMAARSGYPDVIDVIINAGADVNEKDFEKCTALHMACEEGNTYCIQTLLWEGAAVNAATKFGDTPLLLAARQGKPEAMRLLLKKRNIDLTVRSREMSVLHWAAYGGNKDCVEMLLQQGQDPNVFTLDGYYGGNFAVNASVTPLMLACQHCYLDVAQALIEAGAEVDVLDSDGYTPLLYSVRRDHGACVELLLSNGADPNGVIVDTEPPEEGWFPDLPARGISPILLAIRGKSFVALRALLRGNCNLKIPGYIQEGEATTPFELALSKCYTDICQMLLIAGTVVQVTNFNQIQESFAKLLQENEEEFNMLIEQLVEPPKLLQLCRTAVRMSLGRNASAKINTLPLATPLKEFLLLRELDNFHG